MLSTAAAFGWGNMLFWRMGASLVIAVVVGLVFSVEQDTTNVLRPVLTLSHEHDHAREANTSIAEKFRQALLITVDEFFEMGRYLILGALLATGLQTFIPQASLLAIGSGPVLSVLVMLALAILLFDLFHCGRLCGAGFSGHIQFWLCAFLSCLWPHGGYKKHHHVLAGISPPQCDLSRRHSFYDESAGRRHL